MEDEIFRSTVELTEYKQILNLTGINRINLIFLRRTALNLLEIFNYFFASFRISLRSNRTSYKKQDNKLKVRTTSSAVHIRF